MAVPERGRRRAQVRQAAALLLASLLTSCADVPPSQPLAPAALLHAYEQRSLDDPGLRGYLAAQAGNPEGGRGAEPGPAWNLDTLTLAAFYFHPELDAARAHASAEAAAVAVARQRPNPTLQLPFEVAANPRSDESPYTLGLGLDIPIETAARRGYRVEQARRLGEAARLEVGKTAWTVRSRLRERLLSLHAQTRRADTLRRQRDAQREIVDMLEKRVALGAASSTALHQAELALRQAGRDLAHAQAVATDARAGVAEAIGIPAHSLDGIGLRLDAFERVPPALQDDELRRQAVLNRADLRIALAQYAAAQAALQLEVARQMPDLHLGPGWLFDAGTRKFQLPVSGIPLPLFHDNRAAIAHALAQRRDLAAQFNALQIRAIAEAERAAQGYRAVLEELRHAEAIERGESQRLRDVRRAFDAGETGRLELALARQRELDGRLALQEAQTEAQRRIGLLEDAMQRPLAALASSSLLVPPVPPALPAPLAPNE